MSGKSESEKRKSKRSACWHFYEKTPGGGYCRICQKEILTQAGGTTNLRNHLRRKHGELWVACMENRLDPTTLAVTMPANTGDGVANSDEDHSASVAETSSAVHTIQAYRDLNGTTFLYLQPTEGEAGVQIQNQQHLQPIVTSSESIVANGEVVSVAMPKDALVEVQGAEGEPKSSEEAAPRRVVHAAVKNFQGSSMAGRTLVRQMNRPSPMKTAPSANGAKEDTYDNFGKYVASLLRNLPSKTACKLQGEIVHWILKEQMKHNDS